MANITDIISAIINELQKKNRENPNEETADPEVFDILREKIGGVGHQTQHQRRQPTNQTPDNILDIIRQKIEEAQQENRNNPNQRDAPGSIFDHLRKKVDQKERGQIKTSLRHIIQNYNLDVRRVPRRLLRDVEAAYAKERKHLDAKYAQVLHDLSRKHTY